MTIEALIEKLETAEEGSRELDGLIAQSLGLMPLSARWEHRDSYGMLASDPIWVSGGYGDYKFHDPEPYTTSLDAALSLVEKKLPGWYLMIDGSLMTSFEVSLTDSSVPSAEVREDVSRFFARGKTLPLALVTAALRALQAMEA